MQFELSTGIVIIATAAIVLLFIGILSWLGIRQAAKSRELSHFERLKALEMGQAIGPSEVEEQQKRQQHNAFWISFWIGAGVPIAATSAAASVVIQTHLQEFKIILVIWICVAVISVASVVCATVLMIASRRWSFKRDKDPSGDGRT